MVSSHRIKFSFSRRTKTWQPPKPAEIFQLVSDRQTRLIQDGNELLDILIESLKRLEIELQGETPAERDIWDQISQKPLKYKPVDENTFDRQKHYLAQALKLELLYLILLFDNQIFTSIPSAGLFSCRSKT